MRANGLIAKEQTQLKKKNKRKESHRIKCRNWIMF